MSVTSMPQAEVFPAATFEEYRALCDAQDGFRRVGMQNPDAYGAAVSDEQTIFVRIGRSAVPALVDISHEDGYAAQHARTLTGNEDTRLVTIPLEYLNDAEVKDALSEAIAGVANAPAVVVEEAANATNQDNREAICAALGVGYAAKNFIEQDLLRRPGHETAWIALYGYSLEPTEAAAKDGRAADVSAVWQQYRAAKRLPEQPSANSNDTYMFSGEDLKANPALLDKIWEIQKYAFGHKLQGSHPVSMEESREFFESGVLSGDTYTAVRFEDGEPVCFGSMATSMENCAWLNLESSFFKKELAGQQERNELLVFFSEVSRKGGAATESYSADIFNLFVDLTGRTGRNMRLLFESTNRSSMYIPRGVEYVVRASGILAPRDNEGIKELGRVRYWYAESNA